MRVTAKGPPESPLAPVHNTRNRFVPGPTKACGSAKYAHIVRLSSPHHNILYHVPDWQLIGWIPKLDGRFEDPSVWMVLFPGGHFHIHVLKNVTGRDAMGPVRARNEVVAGLAVLHASDLIADDERFIELPCANQEARAEDLPIGHQGHPLLECAPRLSSERTRVAGQQVSGM